MQSRNFNSKFNKDLNINPVTLNLIQKKVGNGIDTGDYFLNITSVAQTLTATINKWVLLKLRRSCETKDIVNKKTCSLKNGKITSSIPQLTEG